MRASAPSQTRSEPTSLQPAVGHLYYAVYEGLPVSG